MGIFKNKNGTFYCSTLHKGKCVIVGTFSSIEAGKVATRLLKERLSKEDRDKVIIDSIEGELWVPVLGHEGLYEISNKGRVKSTGRVDLSGKSLMPKIMNQYSNRGHKFVGMYPERGKVKYKMVHILMCESFILKRPIPEGFMVNHLDGIKDHNVLENLEVVTARENSCHYTKSKKSLSKYTGVSKLRNSWVASIWINGKNKRIGAFDTEEEAGLAYANEMKKNGITNKYAVTPQF